MLDGTITRGEVSFRGGFNVVGLPVVIASGYMFDPNTGSAFAIPEVPSGNTIEFAYVDDCASILKILRLSK